MLTGSAPISTDVIDFLKIAFSAPIFEGYGQTETSAASLLTESNDFTSGHVGIPTPSNEVKLVDVPEMGYTSDDPRRQRGEICLRGPQTFLSYYKDPERTAEVIDADGWVHTGDIGEWTETFQMRIIDRKKNIFKLSQGEYVAPEKIENFLLQAPIVEQIFVTGNSLRSALVSIVVPDRELALKWGASSRLPFEEICKNDAFNAYILGEINSFARSQKLLKGFEIPKAVFIEIEPFSIENGLLTTTFKLKRFEAEKRYKEHVEHLYAGLEEPL
ncbi:hypothetical protein DI09_30p50 [Mitosporidium daphniae]|uniref:AMP-dependent synthetase/ligase domain-containing protein n=1 Tax=Mitosporidium daphniae TaxID=1485682 RepID=A0A098VRZ4_9MICR|nr:uncharacterized protein DI09_30p50 [Mitosporidium daphniae]KGG51589.1 hypothetical protein DI09_30p50 [Mitosporidium daphniae]|eukprot:XP_013238047.1 uncharacterized protein DI09_30p50 [Mitosporidium daphniae]